jgi:hypothetical protein
LYQLANDLSEQQGIAKPKHSDTVYDDGKDWIASLGDETKADRIVRTAAGARHYSQPIGSVIVADLGVRVDGIPGRIDKADPNPDSDFDDRNSWCRSAPRFRRSTTRGFSCPVVMCSNPTAVTA